MVDNKHKPTTTQEFLDAYTDEQARKSGYPSAEVYRMEHKLVILGWKLSLGDKSVHDEYYTLLDEALAKGWDPTRLDGEQEVKMGWTLQEEAIEKYEALQAKVPK
jgi:hypothetical protein